MSEKNIIKAPIPTGGVELGVPRPPANMRAADVVTEGVLSAGEKPTFFFVNPKAKDPDWGSLGRDRDVTGITVLRCLDEQGIRWAGVPGARVVLRLRDREGHEAVPMDLCTKGDGSSAHLPMFPGRMIAAGTKFRVEVYPTGVEETVRVALHGIQAED